MKFYWPEGPTEVILPMGSKVRGIQQKGLRPISCCLSPSEVREFLVDRQDDGVERLHAYLHLCEMALRK